MVTTEYMCSVVTMDTCTRYTIVKPQWNGAMFAFTMCRFVVGVAGYFIVGMVLRKFIFHKEGSDIVPQKEFWMSFPFLIKVNGAGPW